MAISGFRITYIPELKHVLLVDAKLGHFSLQSKNMASKRCYCMPRKKCTFIYLIHISSIPTMLCKQNVVMLFNEKQVEKRIFLFIFSCRKPIINLVRFHLLQEESPGCMGVVEMQTLQKHSCYILKLPSCISVAKEYY